MATSGLYIGGGVPHSEAMMRRELYSRVAGAEGIVEPADMQVLPLEVLGGGVRVTIGSVYIRARQASASREMYMGSVTTQETVLIPPNEGASVRHDLIVMRVKDPFHEGSPWTDPGAGIEDPVAAQQARDGGAYYVIEVITGVPAGTTRLQDVVTHENDTAYTLARVEMQPGTQVDDDMIKKLREVAVPNEKHVVRNFAATGSILEIVTNTAAYPAGGQTWPLQAEIADVLKIKIPDWATHMSIDLIIFGVGVPGGNASGHLWVRVGANTGFYVSTQTTNWDTINAVGWSRETLGMADTIPVPEQLRGTVQQFRPRINRLSGSDATAVRLDAATSLSLRVTFEQRAI